ncbi:MAG TPA: hypothetical protein DD434_10930 [Bacteroidales bacterium]|jgi:formylmethanofuran dehydrogenase subunit B|nr:hypothetical protein [Spirochaetales bacterium]HBN06283.1 hypothetical protein [Bacteroidales bacterium]
MKAEEIFKEILKSPELQSVFRIQTEELKNVSLHEKSDYPVIEIIKEIINGQENHKNKEQIFQIIQKQIIQL